MPNTDYRETGQCPYCGDVGLSRDSADVGVGVIYGPYGCGSCGWSEWPEYDNSTTAPRTTESGAIADQYGTLHPLGCHCLLPGVDGCAMRPETWSNGRTGRVRSREETRALMRLIVPDDSPMVRLPDPDDGRG